MSSWDCHQHHRHDEDTGCYSCWTRMLTHMDDGFGHWLLQFRGLVQKNSPKKKNDGEDGDHNNDAFLDHKGSFTEPHQSAGLTWSLANVCWPCLFWNHVHAALQQRVLQFLTTWVWHPLYHVLLRRGIFPVLETYVLGLPPTSLSQGLEYMFTYHPQQPPNHSNTIPWVSFQWTLMLFYQWIVATVGAEDLNLHYANIPYESSSSSHQWYRVVVGLFMCNHFSSWLCIVYAMLDHGMRLERALTSWRVAQLALVCGVLSNILYRVVAYAWFRYITHSPTVLLHPAPGAWMGLWSWIVLDGRLAHQAGHHTVDMFLLDHHDMVLRIPIHYYPLVLYVGACVVTRGTAMLPNGVALAVAYWYTANHNHNNHNQQRCRPFAIHSTAAATTKSEDDDVEHGTTKGKGTTTLAAGGGQDPSMTSSITPTNNNHAANNMSTRPKRRVVATTTTSPTTS